MEVDKNPVVIVGPQYIKLAIPLESLSGELHITASYHFKHFTLFSLRLADDDMEVFYLFNLSVLGLSFYITFMSWTGSVPMEVFEEEDAE